MRLSPFAFAAALIATPALAQPIVVADSGDTAWLLAAALLVLVAALPGAAMLLGGVRARVAQLGALAIGLLLFAALGYSLAFGDGSPILGGLGNGLLGRLADLRIDTTVPESAYVVFQAAAAALALSLLVVPLAGRARLGWLLGFSAVWLLVVYVPVARWMWGGGWIAAAGGLDFAGGLVIAASAGVSGLVVALLLRTRAPREDQGVATPTSTGAALVLIGGLALAGGSAMGAGDDAAAAILDAVLAASAGVVVSLILTRRALAEETLWFGALAGLAAILASAGFVGPVGAALVGIVGALVAFAAARFVRGLGIADSAATFAIFGAAGMAGALVFPLCVAETLGGPGFDLGAGFLTQLVAQALAVGAVALWSAVATAIAALAVSAAVPMRAD